MPVVAIVVAAAFGVVAALEGAYIWHGSRRPPPEPVQEVVEAVVAPTLAHEDTVQQVTETDRARWVCEGEHYDADLCAMATVCPQTMAAEGLVPVAACDGLVNLYVGRRWVEVVEAPVVDPDGSRREPTEGERKGRLSVLGGRK